MYKYEPHMHTREGSGCSSASAEDMARAHKAAGYDGIFVTNHFFNGNTCVPRDLPWKERIDLFCAGYEKAKEEGEKIGLKVFFGLEYCAHRAADFLIYNISKEWLKENQYLLDMADEKECFREIHSAGGFIVHAHPFRLYPYIHHINLYPEETDAVEVINASHLPESRFDERADIYADMYGFPKTGGSDSHHLDKLFGGGIEVPEPINSPDDYYRQLTNGSVIPLKRTLQ